MFFPSFCVLLASHASREILRCAFIVENLTYFDDVYEIMMTDVNTFSPLNIDFLNLTQMLILTPTPHTELEIR